MHVYTTIFSKVFALRARLILKNAQYKAFVTIKLNNLSIYLYDIL